MSRAASREPIHNLSITMSMSISFGSSGMRLEFRVWINWHYESTTKHEKGVMLYSRVVSTNTKIMLWSSHKWRDGAII